MKKRSILLLACIFTLTASMVANNKNIGELKNLVCFVRFADETSEDMFDVPFSTYQQLFNDENVTANSVYNYFQQASYKQLSWKSSFFPLADGEKVISYRAENPRGYYQKKTMSNPIGYDEDNAVDRAAREQALIKEVAAYLSKNLPDDVILDGNGDNNVDNICFILSGNSDLSARYLLWPHRTDLALPDEKAIYIKDKKVIGYLLVFNNANGWGTGMSPIDLNTGVLCHEMSHSLGTYDLYHVNDDLNPVGIWDLMSDNQWIAQHMTAYTKWRYCKWIDEIPEISKPGTYTLNPIGGETKENIAYKIHPVGSDEYFVVEYRKKDGLFDVNLPESGLIVYRINPNLMGGNLNYNGTTRLDEQYIFRPGGTTRLDGDILKAALSAESGRTSIGGATDDIKPYYSDGKPARFAIGNVSTCGETISFDLIEQEPQIYLPVSTITLNGTSNAKMEVEVVTDVDWKIESVPTWLQISALEGKAGTTVITVTALSENTEAQPRVAEITLTSTDQKVTNTLTVKQSSNLIQSPTGLTATEVGTGGITLNWAAPQEGKPLIAEGFEDAATSDQWEIRNTRDRGWLRQENDRRNPAYKGNYSMRMRETFFDEFHQDEFLISPSFENGATLSFYSRSIAPGKDNDTNFYYVEVSRDNGETWEKVYDLVKDCPKEYVNKYVRIDIDLTPYMSPTMKIAFHAFDNDTSDQSTGLSYWWHVDDVLIYGKPEKSIITHYDIYRNGVKIGSSEACTFTDAQPLEGGATYTVRAVGEFGETPDSNPAVIGNGGTGITHTTAADIRAYVTQGMLYVHAEMPVRSVELFSIQGTRVLQQAGAGNEFSIPVEHLNKGIYVVRCVMEDKANAQLMKVVVD